MKKYRIGYTTGVFDMFHIGHLNILKQANELCDFLIVGVSTDECVYSYKNRFPVIPYEQRAEIVKSIRYVDMVVPQTSMDKVMAWNKFHFNVLFHGDDWKHSEMYNAVESNLRKLGVDVVYLKHTDGISSTLLRERIKSSYN